MTEAEAKTETTAESSSGRASAIAGCLIKGIVGLALLVGVLFVVQSMLVPDVEDNKTVQIEVGAKEAAQEEVPVDVESVGPKKLTDTISMKQIESAEHPLDPLMELADRGLEIIDSRYSDYSSKMLSQVRTGGTLNEENLMLVKVRHDQESDTNGEKSITPFSIYTRFLKPKSKVGQEAIWVRGKDNEQILAHGTGLINFKTFRLPPLGSLAMQGNRYPIYQIGFRNLIIKMKEFGENDRKYGECEVQIDRNVSVDGRSCTLLTITHPKKRKHFDYHIARIYIDDEYEVPTGYEGFLWPEKEGGEPELLEKYFYLDLKLNCNFKDIDFDIANPEYDYPAW